MNRLVVAARCRPVSGLLADRPPRNKGLRYPNSVTGQFTLAAVGEDDPGFSVVVTHRGQTPAGDTAAGASDAASRKRVGSPQRLPNPAPSDGAPIVCAGHAEIACRDTSRDLIPLDRERVPVGIAEPGDFAAPRPRGDPLVIGCQPVVVLEAHAVGDEFVNHSLHIVDVPGGQRRGRAAGVGRGRVDMQRRAARRFVDLAPVGSGGRGGEAELALVELARAPYPRPRSTRSACSGSGSCLLLVESSDHLGSARSRYP